VVTLDLNVIMLGRSVALHKKASHISIDIRRKWAKWQSISEYRSYSGNVSVWFDSVFVLDFFSCHISKLN
jgi:hypothetical protein